MGKGSSVDGSGSEGRAFALMMAVVGGDDGVNGDARRWAAGGVEIEGMYWTEAVWVRESAGNGPQLLKGGADSVQVSNPKNSW